MSEPNKPRRIGYLRWRLRNQKPLKDRDMAELKAYVVETQGVSAPMLAAAAEASTDGLRKMTREQLVKIAAGLRLEDESTALKKDELVDRISAYVVSGFIDR